MEEAKRAPKKFVIELPAEVFDLYKDICSKHGGTIEQATNELIRLCIWALMPDELREELVKMGEKLGMTTPTIVIPPNLAIDMTKGDMVSDE